MDDNLFYSELDNAKAFIASELDTWEKSFRAIAPKMGRGKLSAMTEDKIRIARNKKRMLEVCQEALERIV